MFDTLFDAWQQATIAQALLVFVAAWLLVRLGEALTGPVRRLLGWAPVVEPEIDLVTVEDLLEQLVAIASDHFDEILDQGTLLLHLVNAQDAALTAAADAVKLGA